MSHGCDRWLIKIRRCKGKHEARAGYAYFAQPALFMGEKIFFYGGLHVSVVKPLAHVVDHLFYLLFLSFGADEEDIVGIGYDKVIES